MTQLPRFRQRHVVPLAVCLLVSQALAQGSLPARINQFLAPYVATRDFGGVVLIARGSTPTYRHAFGMADYERNVLNRVDTRFMIGSISKGLTAATILSLRDDGLLDLHDPVSKYIPDYPRGNEITLQHLLLHHSGIPDWGSFPDAAEMQRRRSTLAEIVDWFKTKPLDFAPPPPGIERHRYSSSGYVLLADIVERITAKPFAAVVGERVLRPLHMSGTSSADARAIVPGRALGYMPAHDTTLLGNADWFDPSIMVGSGSFLSTADDLLRWALSSTMGRLSDAAGAPHAIAVDAGGDSLHPFVSEAGIVPGFGAIFRRYARDDVTIIVLNNINTGAIFEIANGLEAIVFGKPYNVRQAYVPVTLDDRRLLAFEGRYRRSSTDSVAVERLPDGLYIRFRSEPFHYPLFPLSDSTLFYRQGYGTVTGRNGSGGAFSTLVFSYGGPPLVYERLR
ncbi:MAG TPA: serine hydrolase domain-containing protein [Gemmatimonadaceae bacterium]|nr:serine hydrolase domain-containing protein [Gemmatimonadaceae bacterium]